MVKISHWIRVISRRWVRYLFGYLNLSIGLLFCLVLCFWADYEFIYDKRLPNTNNIYRTSVRIDHAKLPSNHSILTPGALAQTLKSRFPDIKESSRLRYQYWHMKIESILVSEPVAIVDPSFFSIFQFKFILGNPLDFNQKANSIVITEKLANRIFGDAKNLNKCIGKTIEFSNQFFTICGVLEEIPPNSNFNNFCYVSSSLISQEKNSLNNWKTNNYRTFLLLNEGSNPNSLQKKIGGVIQEFYPESNASIYITPFWKWHLFNANGSPRKIVQVIILMLAGIFVLIIAALNYTNILLGASFMRGSEIRLRKISGAYNLDIFKQFFNENLLYLAASVLSSVVLFHLILPKINNIFNIGISFNIDIWLLAILFIILGIIILITAIYPASLMSRYPIKKEKLNRNNTFINIKIRNILIAVQTNISIILLITAFSISTQLKFIMNKNLGYNPNHIVCLNSNSELNNHYELLREKLVAHPNVTHVTRTNTPLDMWESSAEGPDIDWEGKINPDDGINKLAVLGVDYDFEKVYEINIHSGRFFSREFPTDVSSSFIINKTAAERMELSDPLGKTLSVWNKKGTIIGVVEDFHFSSLKDEIIPMALSLKWNLDNISIKIAANDIQQTLTSIKSVFGIVLENNEYIYSFQSDRLNALYFSEKKTLKMVNIATTLAIFLAFLGILGVIIFNQY